MKKYYLMAIDKSHSCAKNNLKNKTNPLEWYIYYEQSNIYIYKNKLKIYKTNTC